MNPVFRTAASIDKFHNESYGYEKGDGNMSKLIHDDGKVEVF